MPEQDPTQFRLGALVERAGEAFDNIKGSIETKAAILTSAIALAGGVAVANLLKSEPAQASPAPEATASNLQQDCIETGTVMPELIKFRVSGAGTPSQFIKARVRVEEEMPPACYEDYQRLVGFKFQYKKANRWISLRPYWRTIHSRNTASNNVVANEYPSGHNETDSYYMPCIPGKRQLPMRGLFQNKVKRMSDSTIVARKIKIVPRNKMKVRPANC